jgi:hypothetical protein
MTALTNHGESQVIKWAFTDDSVTRPSAWYVALHTADPTEVGNVGEVSGNGYARQSAVFNEDTNGLVDNDSDIVFGPNTTSNWGDITHVSIWDAASGGNCWMKGALSSPVTIQVGDSFRFPAGDLDLSAL